MNVSKVKILVAVVGASLGTGATFIGSTPAISAPTCLLEVGGRRLLDGSCDAVRMSDGRLAMGDHRGTGALVKPDFANSDRAIGAFRSDSQMYHDLGELRRDGTSCWRGRGVRFCAWGVQ